MTKEEKKASKHKEDHKIRYNILKYSLGGIFWLYFRPKLVNKKVIPKEGPILVCANHINMLDQCLPIMCTRRMIHYMAKKEYFDGKFAWFFKAAGCISVNRQIHDKGAVGAALDVLNNGYALGLFPEGTRNRTEDTLLPFKLGAVSMAQKTGATIVPCAITGKYKFWNNKLKVTFLEPFKVGKDDNLEEVNERFRNMIKDFLEEEKAKEEAKEKAKAKK